MLSSTVQALLLGLVSHGVALTYKGVDWSSVQVVESPGGYSFKTASGAPSPLERILAGSGVNTVRQRIWVDPSSTYNVDYNIALAKRAKAAGMGVFLDLHLSDTWADPAHQAIPSGWPSDINNLAWRLYNYTLDVSNAFQNAGVQPSIISIGNEITAGFLWPTGHTSSYANIARLLHSAASGIRYSKLRPLPKIMIHLDNGWDWGTQQFFYDTVLKQGTLSAADFDMMGVSYYPFYNSGATLAALHTSLTNMANTWHKEMVVAETDWPTSCPTPAFPFPSDVANIPFTAAGQTKWMLDVAGVVSSVPGGVGLFYWEPAWINNANLGSSCPDNLMFSKSGQALPSLAVFGTI